VGRAGPLAIDNLMEVVGVLDVGRLQCFSFDPEKVLIIPAFYALPQA